MPERSDFVGLVSEDVFAGDETYRSETIEKEAETGVGLIRQTFDWSRIELERGKYDFSASDPWVEKLAEERMRVLPILFNPPAVLLLEAGHRRAPGHLPAAAAAGHRRIRPRAGGALRAGGVLLGGDGRAEDPDPQLADLERAQPADLLAERAGRGRVHRSSCARRPGRSRRPTPRRRS